MILHFDKIPTCTEIEAARVEFGEEYLRWKHKYRVLTLVMDAFCFRISAAVSMNRCPRINHTDANFGIAIRLPFVNGGAPLATVGWTKSFKFVTNIEYSLTDVL